MEITGASTSALGLGAGRLETPRAVPAAEPVDDAGAMFVEPVVTQASDAEAKSRFVPAGLTFSPAGLSAGTERRFIADL